MKLILSKDNFFENDLVVSLVPCSEEQTMNFVFTNFHDSDYFDKKKPSNKQDSFCMIKDSENEIRNFVVEYSENVIDSQPF